MEYKPFQIPKILLLALAFAFGILTWKHPFLGLGSILVMSATIWILVVSSAPARLSPLKILFREILPIVIPALLGLGFATFHFMEKENDLAKVDGQRIDFLAEINGDPWESEKWHKCKLKPMNLIGNEEILLAGQSIMYYAKDCTLYKGNDLVAVKGRVKAISADENEYYAFLTGQGIHSVFYADEISLHRRPKPKGFGRLRTSLLSQVRSGLGSGPEANLAAGLVLGNRSELPDEIRAAFRDAGLSHVLAISGMHLAMLYAGLMLLLTRFLPGRRWNWLRHGSVVAVVWGFALLTGGTPSACRAAFMMTCLSAGRVFYLRTPGLNVLSGACIVLLVLDPSDLFNPGFQLSFAAVFGIITVSSPFSKWLKKRFHFLPKKIANAISITLTAQLFTTPFVIFHFGTFPTYFLVSNLLILPLVTFAVYLGFTYLIIGSLPFLGEVIGIIFKSILWLMIETATWIAKLPGAVIDQTNWDSNGPLIIIGFILGFGILMTIQVFWERFPIIPQKITAFISFVENLIREKKSKLFSFFSLKLQT